MPVELQDIFKSISQSTDEFSKEHLNDEYSEYIRYAIAELCRKRPSPLLKGKINIWACAITHAIGWVNFLDDSSQTPHVKPPTIYEWFDVKASTGQSKSKQVRNILKITQFDQNWTLPSRIDQNPMIWMISVNGFMVDVRNQPREIQEIAFQKGIIPYIPE